MVNEPHLTLFVGEALVGNEAVDQLVKFNRALADHSSTNTPQVIDGILLTKFDTIDDKVIFTVLIGYFFFHIYAAKLQFELFVSSTLYFNKTVPTLRIYLAWN